MSDNVVQFPRTSPDLFANIEAHLETIDSTVKNEPPNLAKLITLGIGLLVDGYHSGDQATDLAAAIDGLLLSYLAIGTLLGAERQLMISSLRHGQAHTGKA